MKIIDGTGNTLLVSKISRHLRIPIVKSDIHYFADGEISIEIFENMRGEDTFVIQSMSHPVNNNLMKLVLIIDTLKRASAKTINVICPYLCYSRQDRKAGPRTPISARVVADMISSAGADRLVTVDLHAEQIQGFYTNTVVDNLYGSIIFKDIIKKMIGDAHENSVIVSPDIGGLKRARIIGEYLGIPICVIEKRRARAGECEIMNVIGDTKSKRCIIVDDIIDSGKTICNASEMLKRMGAISVIICVTHGVLSPGAIELLESSCIDKICVSNTLDNSTKTCYSSKWEVVDFSKLLANAITAISRNESISELFN
jgi:ribose-phosphate pyrophosphokinase